MRCKLLHFLDNNSVTWRLKESASLFFNLKSEPQKTEKSVIDIFLIALTLSLMAMGLVTRLHHYLENYSLWLDEAMLAYNIVNVNFIELTEPLPFFSQTGPLFYLWLVKISGALSSYNEYSLRLPSVLGGMVSFGFLIYALHRFFSPWAALIAAFLYAVNEQSLRYSVELKHYSLEAMSTAVMIYIFAAAINNNLTRFHFILLGVFGAASIWISNNSILVLSSMGFILLAQSFLYGSKKYLSVFLVGFFWIASFVFNFYFFTSDSIKNQFSLYSHVYEAGHMPLNSFSEALAWSWLKVKAIIHQSLPGVGNFDRYGASVALIFLIFYGTLRNLRMLGFIFILFGAILTLSAFRAYPFLPGRYTHFLQPVIIFSLSAGMYQFVTDCWVGWRSRAYSSKRYISYSFCTAGLAALILFGLYLVTPIWMGGMNFNRELQETRPLIQYYKESKSPEDKIFVYYGSLPAFEYYIRNDNLDFYGKIPYGSTSSWVSQPRTDYDSYLDLIESAIRESRGIYFLFSHARKQEKKRALDLIGKYGSVVLVKATPGAELFYLAK